MSIYKKPVGGGNGKSAYQSWLDQGNTGTEAAFVASLKGSKGDVGTAGSALTFKAWPTGVTKVADVLTPGTYQPPRDNSVTDYPKAIKTGVNYLSVIAWNNNTRLYLLLENSLNNASQRFYVGYRHNSGPDVFWTKMAAEKFRNQSLCLLGDSITSSLPPAQIMFRTGLTVTGLAYSGSSIALRNPAQAAAQDPWSLCTRSKVGETNSIAIENYDYALIFMGTNDWGNSHLMGTVDSVDEHEVLGALNVALTNFLTRNPKVKILIAAPLYRTGGTNPASYMLLNDFCKGIESVAKKYGIPFTNLHEEGGVNSVNATTYLQDGLHLTLFGQEHIIHVLTNFIEQNYGIHT